MNAGTQIVELLELDRQPVAIQFQDTAPPGTPHIEHAQGNACKEVLMLLVRPSDDIVWVTVDTTMITFGGKPAVMSSFTE